MTNLRRTSARGRGRPFAAAVALAGALVAAPWHAPAARADGAEDSGLQSAAESMRSNAARGAPAWWNGTATLVAGGEGYDISYAGTPRGGVGLVVASVVGATDGGPIVEYGDTGPSTGRMLARQR
jgi:hypothetical protein